MVDDKSRAKNNLIVMVSAKGISKKFLWSHSGRPEKRKTSSYYLAISAEI